MMQTWVTADFDLWMREALDEAKASIQEGGHGFGAVIVKDGTIIAQARDGEETDGDPTSHAELNAIRLAAQALGRDLSGCLLVATHEPCPMCTAAAIWAGIREVAYGYPIREAIAAGRRRIDVSCLELYTRAGVEAELHEGVLHDECSMLYRQEVRDEIERLKGATAADLERYGRDLADKRLRWYRKREHRLHLHREEPLVAAYELMLEKLGVQREQMTVVEEDAEQIVLHSRNFCPTLEACKILDLDTREVCRAMTERPMDALLKRLNPNLQFSRNYDKLRPYSDYCEEVISLRALTP